MSVPRLIADDAGIWTENTSAHRSGIRWDETYCISGHRLDCKTRVVTVVNLDWDYGEYFELMDDWPGFEEVTRLLSSRVPGLNSQWLDRVRAMSPRDPSIEIWKRTA